MNSINIFIVHDNKKIDVDKIVEISEVEVGITVIETDNKSLYSRKFDDDLIVMRINNHKLFGKIEGMRFIGIDETGPRFEIVCNRNKIDEETKCILNMIY